MQVNENDLDLAVNDLGPLAWVLDELRKSLDTASGALRRFVRDATAARGTDMASVDAGQLRIARQQLHQAVGALEMVGLGAPAYMLRSMEAAVQKFIERPDLCSEASAAKVERAGFALTEYLEGVLLGKPVSAVALFPQYRDVQELAGADRIHPADLWPQDWRWVEPETEPVEPVAYDVTGRARLDQAVLKIVKSGDAQAAHSLVSLAHGFSSAQTVRQPRIFWTICGAYFEALSLGLLPLDVYVKRAASRVLLQYASLAKGELGVSDRLAQDLVFFCSQAVPLHETDAPLLVAVRKAYGLARFKPVDYQTSQFGSFDPVLLMQARKRISIAKETWSALSGGDTIKLKGVADQFNLVTDSLTKLHPPSSALAQALSRAVDSCVQAGQPPRAELAMEVATSVLYLEAAFADLDPNDPQLAVRTNRLADRLEHVSGGGQPEPLETWMEELYRRVNDRQTMGSVVGELRTTLSELEKLLDNFFRNPKEKAALSEAPGYLSQMRGVLSVLGLDQAAQAVLRMRDSVEQILVTEIDEERARAAGTFDKLGNNLGALGFLIDMLNYQPSLAKKLFVYDDEQGELRPLMGRSVEESGPADVESAQGQAEQLSEDVLSVVSEADHGASAENLTIKLDALAERAVLADQSGLAHSAREAAAAVSANDAGATSAALSQLAAVVHAPAPAPMPTAPEAEVVEDDLRDIFLEEAREVIQNGLAAVRALAIDPGDLGEMTTLRRAFHTLKGSSRMVGLTEFGEGAWSMEQLLNTWLADQKHADESLRRVAAESMRGFSHWVDDIAQGTDSAWRAAMFRGPADALRVEQRVVEFNLPVGLAGTVAPEPAIELGPELSFDIPEGPKVAAAGADQSLHEATALAPLEEAPFAFDLADAQIEVAQDVQPVTSSEPDFDFDLSIESPSALAEVPTTSTTIEPTAMGVAAEIDGIDFGSLSAVAGPADASSAGAYDAAAFASFDVVEPMAEAQTPLEADSDALSDLSFDVTPVQPTLHEAPASTPEPDSLDTKGAHDEQVKIIGSLSIGIPLYNVYLNEADEWSRRLVAEVGEWALELNRPVHDSTVGLAHALAGSSATVGFQSLSDIARALENALQNSQPQAYGTAGQAKVFTEAAEEIRRLLHQFAAGFLKEADPQLIERLADLRNLAVPSRAELLARDSAPSPIDEDFSDLDFADVSIQTDAAVSTDSFVMPLSESATPELGVPQLRVTDGLDSTPVAVEATTLQPSPVHVPSSVVPLEVVASSNSLSLSLSPSLAADFDDEDDIDVADAIDGDLFPIFEEEANELMPQLGGALRQWGARPDNRGARDEVLRALHTLKGSARLAGALRLGELAHRMESDIEQLPSDAVNAVALEPLLHLYDGMQANFDRLRAKGVAPLQPEETASVAPLVPSVGVGTTAPLAALSSSAVIAQAAAPEKRTLVASSASAIMAPRASAGHAVRVRSQLLDRLVNEAGEIMITRSRLEAELSQLRVSLGDLTGNLDRLRGQLRDIELQAESQMQSRLAQAKDSAAGFDPLEFDRFTRVQELTRMMAESVNDVATVQRNLQRTVEATEDDLIAQARQTRELQRDLLRTRMVEFEGISDRLYRVVRLASKETGKQVKLDITGGSIEMDRGVLDRMTPAFEHLLRNCVAHGIEDPAVRTNQGKDAAGVILIGLHQEGNDVSVEFRDDGAGLNLVRIREKAQAQGLIPVGQAISDAEAANLIFMPGFSTATQVTELAGRGIGMDVVRSEVNALGGRIETTTESGKGTNFKLVLPLTTAVTQVVMVRTGSLSIGVPANLVETVRRATPKDVELAYKTGQYEVGGEMLPFYWSGALLQASQKSHEPESRTLPVVIFRSAAQRIAVHVDEVVGNQEVVVKNLGPQLARLPGLAGMTVLASGAVVLIYNPVALTSVYGDQARALSAHSTQAAASTQSLNGVTAPVQPVLQAPPQAPLILVVDDSITVRRVTQRMLQREGYRVTLAADGLQALERLAEELPTVVLSDIEMPRMDGFDLARNIRGDSRLAKLPIVMITSRIAEKHKEHAMELGVNHYLGKPFSEEELVGLIRQYSAVPVSA